MAAGHPPQEDGWTRSQHLGAAARSGADRCLAEGAAAGGATERHPGTRGSPRAGYSGPAPFSAIGARIQQPHRGSTLAHHGL
eukprot:7502972-Prorocentrum_lima.AAC.1